jgi:hypothetical protein
MLNWTTTQTFNTIIHTTSAPSTTEHDLRNTIETCAEKAISLLKSNIQDDSLYLLFEWDSSNANLNILVTDATKKHDAPEIVFCTFPELAKQLNQPEQSTAYAELVKFWLHDYLTTCTEFFSYSLVAIFHSSNRSNTELL